VIADLHIDLANPASAEPFLRWLGSIPDLPRLVVLGDFFDVWVGPAQARLPGAAAVLDALQARAKRGTAIDVVHGNRDFLLDASFEERTGAKVRPHGLIGRIDRSRDDEPDERVILLHGDELCTRDKAYQRLKKVVRSRPVAGLAPHLPLPVATFLARALRRTSVRALETKPPDTKVLQEAASRWQAFVYDVETVVCGHAHAYRDMRLAAGPRWIVLDAFGGDRDVLEVDRRRELRMSRSAPRST
jgi:UDP-2,3-diacylglucosamine hydrolase